MHLILERLIITSWRVTNRTTNFTVVVNYCTLDTQGPTIPRLDNMPFLDLTLAGSTSSLGQIIL